MHLKFSGLLPTALLVPLFLPTEGTADESPLPVEDGTVECSAKAAIPDDDETAKEFAKQCFEVGLTLYREEKFAEAAAVFRAGYRFSPTWRIWFNIGQCEAAARRYDLAIEAFERYLNEGGDRVPPTRGDEVLAELEKMRAITGLLDITGTAGLDIYLDGTKQGTTPLPGKLAVSAGTIHRLEAVRDGTIVTARDIQVKGSDTMTVNLSVPPPVAPEDAPPAAAPSEPSPVSGETAPHAAGPSFRAGKIAGWTLIGTGAAALIGGGVTGGITLSKSRILEESCDNETQVCRRTTALVDAYDTAKMTAAASTALFAVGGTLATAGLIALVISLRKERQKTAAVRLHPVIGPGFGIGGEF